MSGMNWNKISQQRNMARHGLEAMGKPKRKGRKRKSRGFLTAIKPVEGAITEKQLEAMRSPAGGFTKETLRNLGIPWPPPKGWRSALLAGKPIAPLVERQQARMNQNQSNLL